ncbi:MAG: hypothetical protein SO015_07240, partial [Wujia sp.]
MVRLTDEDSVYFSWDIVSIPHRYGTTTVFKPFLTASFYKLSKITRFFSQKSVNLFFYLLYPKSTQNQAFSKITHFFLQVHRLLWLIFTFSPAFLPVLQAKKVCQPLHFLGFWFTDFFYITPQTA